MNNLLHTLTFAGKTIADARVAGTLYQRAMGWEHPAVKIFKTEEPATDDEGKFICDANGHPVMVSKGLYLPYTERFPPDVGAIRLWLTNRQPKRWRERADVKVDGNITLGDIVRRSYEIEKERGEK